MQVIGIQIGKGRTVLTDDAHVTVYSVDGETAQLIVEMNVGSIALYTADDPEFVHKAKAYGFKAPRIVQVRP